MERVLPKEMALSLSLIRLSVFSLSDIIALIRSFVSFTLAGLDGMIPSCPSYSYSASLLAVLSVFFAFD